MTNDVTKFKRAAFTLALLLAAGCTGEQPAPPPAAPPADTTAQRTARPDTNAASAWSTEIIDQPSSQTRPALLADVQTGRHEGFDRIVFVFEERVPGYHVAYVDGPMRACGSGKRVSVAGEGRLEVQLNPARAYTEAGTSTVEDDERTPGLPTLKELVMTCSGYEAHVTWVLGLATASGYRVDTLAHPPRLTVDVRHP